MRKKIFCTFIVAALAAGCAHLKNPPTSPAKFFKIGELEPLKKNERLLVLAPHPDDEAIGCAGIIQEALRVGSGVRIVYLTNGDHNQAAFIVYEKRLTLKRGEFIHMGEVRRREAIKAMKLLGLDEQDLVFLGYPDFGTFTIFSQYWQTNRPFRSLLTRISSVPYKENLSFGTPYVGESILADLKKMLLDYKPTKIFVSHPADVNVDHKTFYLFLEVALADLKDKIPPPKIYPYLIHCVGWPLPRHYHPELNLEPPSKFLNSQVEWLKFDLTTEQLKNKQRAILCYRSQTETSAFYLLAFGRKNELFGNYPDSKLKNLMSLDMNKEVNYSLLDDKMVLTIHKTNKARHGFGIRLYLFGYSYKIPFAQMGKIRIFTRGTKIRVFDAKRMIRPDDLSLELNDRELVLKIPLELLGKPDFVLASLKASKQVLPVDFMSFRKINIK